MDSVNKIEQAWAENAPPELQSFMKLFLKKSNFAKDDPEVRACLAWVLKNLDEYWQQQATDLIVNGYGDSTLLREVEQRRWRTLLRSWTQIAFSHQVLPPDLQVDGYFEKLLTFFRQSAYPFGSVNTESDAFWLSAHYDGLQVYPEFLSEITCFIIGESGVGKTSTALWLSYLGLKESRDKRYFPIYFQGMYIPTINQLVPVWAKTVLNIIAFDPHSYKERSMMGRASIAHLLSKYASLSDVNLSLALHESGLPNIGLGVAVKLEISDFIQNLNIMKLDTDRLISVLSESFPAGFKYTTLMLDLTFTEKISNRKKYELLSLIALLNGQGISVKMFVRPDFINGFKNDYPIYRLSWTQEDLRQLFRNRLAQITPSELSAWCDPAARMTSPEDRVIAASNGTPAGVIDKLNKLFKRITVDHPYLSSKDLDEVLGPVSTRTRRRP